MPRPRSLGQVAKRDTREIWPNVRKLFDYYEANAEEFLVSTPIPIGNPKIGTSRLGARVGLMLTPTMTHLVCLTLPTKA